jgi:hypothetical protein
MIDELESMKKNNVWDLVELPNDAKPVGCKWVFKTKLDPKWNVERYKVRLVAKRLYLERGNRLSRDLFPCLSKRFLKDCDGPRSSL